MLIQLADWVKRRHATAPLFVLAIGLLGSSLAAAQIWRITETTDRERFAHEVGQTHDDIADRLETYVAMLQAAAGLFAANELAVDRQAFRAFAEQLELRMRYPGIQGIGFTVRSEPENRDAIVAWMRRQGDASFRIWPEEPRDEYHAIVFLEPLDRRNLAAIGYDMFTDPTRRAAMARARDTGQPAASGKVELVQEIEEQKQAGFLIYVAVYRGAATPGSVSERREKLEGFVYSPFRADDLLQGIFPGRLNPQLRFEVYDGAAVPGNLLHRSQHAASAEAEHELPRYTEQRALNVAGREWTLVYASRPEFDDPSTSYFAPVALGGGLLASLLASAATWTQTRARRDAELASATRKLLLDELNHRVKNTLAAVQSIAAQTIRHAESPREFRSAFESRLIALSQAHDLLTRGNWHGASVRDLALAEFAPYEADGRFTVEGEDVRLRPGAALALGMAFHELATNAAKHGALLRPQGRVRVQWSRKAEMGRDCIVILWSESGGPRVGPPSRRGFGSRLIQHGLARELGGKVDLVFDPAGLRCVIEFPLADRAAVS